jgi:hypothetical protein
MSDWTFTLEVNDENDLPLTIDSKSRGFRLVLREKNESILEFVARDLAMDSRIVRGNNCRVYGDPNNTTPTTKQFEGLMIDKNEVGTWNKALQVVARDFFKDRLLTRHVNKNYSSQKAGVIFRDIVQTFVGSEFTINGIEDTSVSITQDFPYWMAHLAADEVATLALAEYFCKPSLDVTFRPARTDDSGLTITESMVRDVSQVKRSLAESVGEAIVVGGLDASSNRVIARVVDDSLPSSIRNRRITIHDKRYTTYQDAKLKALSILSELGRDFVNVPPIDVRDLTMLPRPGQLITLNMPNHNLNNIKLIVKQIEVDARPGEETVRWLKFYLGETEKTVEERILLQQTLFERERARGTMFSEVSTQQLLNARDVHTIAEGGKNIKRCTNFYLDSVPGSDSDGCIFTLDGEKGGSELDL